MRFGLMTTPRSWERVLDDAELAREGGFEILWTPDHLRHPEDPDFPLLEPWTTLGALAVATDELRLGVLVSSIIYRHPAVLAKQAATFDHVSAGRLELGIGAGVYATDHAMTGTEPWKDRERVERLSEAVNVVDHLLRGRREPHIGRYYQVREPALSPPPVQRPRPPLTVAANGRRALRAVAAHGDRWVTFGGFDLDERELLERLDDRQAHLDACCDELGRPRDEIVRALLLFPPLDPWRSVSELERLAELFAGVGFDELVLFAPHDDERPVFERAVSDLLPGLRDELVA